MGLLEPLEHLTTICNDVVYEYGSPGETRSCLGQPSAFNRTWPTQNRSTQNRTQVTASHQKIRLKTHVQRLHGIITGSYLA